MLEVIFLFCLGLIWTFFASIQDLRTSEISDWINYGFVIFALGFRLFFAIFQGEMNFFYQGLIGFGIFFLLGNLFYYSRMFAGGDAKLFMGLGAVLPLNFNFLKNTEIFFSFILILLLVGFIYSLIFSLYFGIKNFKNLRKEFVNQLKKNKKINFVVLFFALIFLILGFYFTGLSGLAIFLFFFFYLYIYLKSVDEACMIKKVKTKDLMEGDWLYEDVKVGNKLLKKSWDGLSEKDIAMLKKNKKFILIRTGIRFAPVFLISYLFLFIFNLEFFGFLKGFF